MMLTSCRLLRLALLKLSIYHTGGSFNNVDINGVNVIAGVAKYFHLLDKSVSLAAFFEHGNGKFETANYFDHEVDDFVVAGTGHGSYNGGGVMAKVKNLPYNLYLHVADGLCLL
jgi:hypothetical protein